MIDQTNNKKTTMNVPKRKKRYSLVLTVVPIVIESTMATVAVFGAGCTHTGGCVLAWVQETCINAVSSKVSWSRETFKGTVCEI